MYAANVFKGIQQECTHANASICAPIHSYSNGANDPILHIIKLAIQIISWVIGVAAVIVLIVAGLEFVFGAGDAKTLATARGAIIYASVGILVAVLAQVLVVYVVNKL